MRYRARRRLRPLKPQQLAETVGRRKRLKLGDTSGYVAAPLPGQLSRALHSAPIPPVAAANGSLAQKDRFPMVPEGDYNCWPNGPQMTESCFQKASGQDLAQKRPFPNGPRRHF